MSYVGVSTRQVRRIMVNKHLDGYSSSSCNKSFTLLPSKSTLKLSSVFTSSNFKSHRPFLFETLIKSNASSRSSTFKRTVIWFRRARGGHALQSVTLDFNSGESMRSFTKFIRYRMSESRLMAPKGVNELFHVGGKDEDLDTHTTLCNRYSE